MDFIIGTLGIAGFIFVVFVFCIDWFDSDLLYCEVGD